MSQPVAGQLADHLSFVLQHLRDGVCGRNDGLARRGELRGREEDGREREAACARRAELVRARRLRLREERQCVLCGL